MANDKFWTFSLRTALAGHLLQIMPQPNALHSRSFQFSCITQVWKIGAETRGKADTTDRHLKYGDDDSMS